MAQVRPRLGGLALGQSTDAVPVQQQQARPRALRVVAFTWNATGLRICENINQQDADQARTGFKAFITNAKPCVAPDFLPYLRGLLGPSSSPRDQPDVFFFATQDESTAGSYFHSDALPKSMESYGYKLLKRDEIANVGEKASGITLRNVPTGVPGGSSLRSSVYIRNDVYKDFVLQEAYLNKFFRGGQAKLRTVNNESKRVTGALCSYVWHPIYGHFALINVHMPTGLLQSVGSTPFATQRSTINAVNHISMIDIMQAFVYNVADDAKPNYVIMAGDFNSSLDLPNVGSNQAVIEQIVATTDVSALRQYDELTAQLGAPPLELFKEGLPGMYQGRNIGIGPTSPPTWRLHRGRDANCQVAEGKQMSATCYQVAPGVTRSANIGWRERVIFATLTGVYELICGAYSVVDVNNIKESTSAAVYGFFDLVVK